ncbi:MAG: metal-sulfur cluster assembly factor [Dehalococcoidia bacterium]
MPTEDQVREVLSEVIDPEIGMDILNLGLIYNIDIEDEHTVNVDMTLTTPACPAGPMIRTQAYAAVATLPGVENVSINLVWSPPWDPKTMMSEDAKIALGIF